MPSRDSDTAALPLRVFGSMLRFYRVKAGISQDQLGGRVYLTGDMIGKVETGQRTPGEQLVGAIEALPELGTDGALTELRDVTLWVILDEGVLRRPVGGPAVMGEQLRHLAKAARRPSVVLQVIPAPTGTHQGLNGGAFVIADFAEEDGPPVGYIDTAVAGQIVESADDTRALAALWDTLKSEALPRSASLELAEEAADLWRRQEP